MAGLVFIPVRGTSEIAKRHEFVEAAFATLLVFAMAGYSGFSNWRVTQASSMDHLELYSSSKKIQAALGTAKDVSVLTIHYDPYLFSTGEMYFQSKFPGIKWFSIRPEEATDAYILQMAKKLKESSTVVLGKTLRETTAWNIPEFDAAGENDFFRVLRE